jgi:hypothetical protein
MAARTGRASTWATARAELWVFSCIGRIPDRHLTIDRRKRSTAGEGDEGFDGVCPLVRRNFFLIVHNTHCLKSVLCSMSEIKSERWGLKSVKSIVSVMARDR